MLPATSPSDDAAAHSLDREGNSDFEPRPLVECMAVAEPEVPERPKWYFDAFEDRRPRAPMPYHAGREWALQATAVCAVTLGIWYLTWRWSSSVNWQQWYVGVPLIVAETLAFIGTILFFASTARIRDTPMAAPPSRLSDIQDTETDHDRTVSVDLFIPTYNEDPELVRLSIRDAKRMRYPHPIDLRIHVLDDGKRLSMRNVAADEEVSYLTRSSNLGYKAGNLRNALENTHGDLVVICDADTRVFPQFLERTLGYFRDRQVAWVQTPQWFYDLEEGTALPEWLAHRARLGRVGAGIGKILQALVGPVRVGSDPLGNDPEMFYDVILRRCRILLWRRERTSPRSGDGSCIERILQRNCSRGLQGHGGNH
jgi:cellulose synthase (UDP-forming)